MKSIVFVYNAKSGKMQAWLDTLHKLISPSSYACRLCAITYGNTKMRLPWKNFIESLDIETEFLHTDEFEKKYQGISTRYPVAFLNNSGILSVFISVEEMEVMDLEKLMELVTQRIAAG